MNFVAPAGSNVGYIGLIINGMDVESCLSYHTIYKKKAEVNFKWSHDLDKKISEHDIKIYFNHTKEIIPLNWYTKFILKPVTELDKKDGIEWIKSQSDIWKEKYGSEWMTRAALRWMYNLDKQNLGLGKLDEDKHFDGTCLYDGYEMSLLQFKKFGVTYHEHQYEQWMDSQKNVVDMLTKNMQCDSIDKVHILDDYFCRGIALATLARRSSLTEESAWQYYIK